MTYYILIMCGLIVISSVMAYGQEQKDPCGPSEIFLDGKCVNAAQNCFLKGGTWDPKSKVCIITHKDCLIATASYGSAMAPEVQQLREIRDQILLKTDSGTSFMIFFNSFYYSFSPTIAEWERQNPLFKELVKTLITPLISTLSILNYVDINSEQELLGYGIGIILLNVGTYFVLPVIVILKIKSRLSLRKL